MKIIDSLEIQKTYALRPASYEKGLTPMMTQYLEVKEKNENTILFYRMGDFYEMFFEDAILASSILDITLTKRGEWNFKKIPMCGFPAHSSDNYLEKLIKKGFKVSICEQIEKKLQSDKRAPMHREVVRIVTPGTVTEDNLLNPETHNYLASISEISGKISVSWVDMTTGNFLVESISGNQEYAVESVLNRLRPKEIILSKTLKDQFREVNTGTFTVQPDSIFNSSFAEEKLKGFFKVISLNAFGVFSESCISAAGSILAYIDLTQKGQLPLLQNLKKWENNNVLEIDSTTRRSLELTSSLSGDSKGGLYNTINKTITKGGGRLLFERLNAPLLNIGHIEERLSSVSMFFNNSDFLRQFKKIIFKMPDVLRSLSRLQFNRAGPRDLGIIKDGLYVFFETISLFDEYKKLKKPKNIKLLINNLKIKKNFRDNLTSALSETLPILIKDGDFINIGFSKELDYLRNLKEKSKKFISLLEKKYIELTNISSLKIKYNNVLGYHIEIRKIHIDKINQNEKFIHRQSTAQASRYTTVELSDLEKELLSANEEFTNLEKTLFNNLREKILKISKKLIIACNSISDLDVSSSNASLALEWNYCKPTLTQKNIFKVSNARHPVLEQIIYEKNDNRFLGNDCELNENNNIWLITGPNMAGKSTFLRQNALINILAQMGCYVPADKATIGIADRIFSRVGSGDDISKGQSTFMLEMLETASIVNQSSEKSFIILDEIGRGTSTWDGLSLAWSIIEYINEKIGAKTLFATHYHELSDLENKIKKLSLHHFEVKEIEEEITFIYQIMKGTANKSYGIEVAKLAGLPKSILDRAKEVLLKLEDSSKTNKVIAELPLFNEKNNIVENNSINEKLGQIDPDKTSPIQALEILYELKKML